MQEKESIMVVRCELKIPSLGISVRQHSASLVMPNSYFSMISQRLKSLLNHSVKVMLKIISNRLQPQAEKGHCGRAGSRFHSRKEHHKANLLVCNFRILCEKQLGALNRFYKYARATLALGYVVVRKHTSYSVRVKDFQLINVSRQQTLEGPVNSFGCVSAWHETVAGSNLGSDKTFFRGDLVMK